MNGGGLEGGGDGRGAANDDVDVEDTVTCDHCGRTVEGAAPPLSWSLAVERGRVQRYCDVCTRENLRSMEGKLDVQHW